MLSYRKITHWKKPVQAINYPFKEWNRSEKNFEPIKPTFFERFTPLPEAVMKRFDQRNILKKKVNDYQSPLYVKEREVRSTYLGENVGNEEDGKWRQFQRPILIIKRVGAVLFVVPMTTRGKESRYYYTLPEHYFGKISRVILSQAKHIDARRLTYKVGTIKKEDFSQIKKKLRDLIL